MQVRVHRGTAEIGGSCIEVAADDGGRIVLDVGRPLSAGWDDKVDYPAVPGFAQADPTLAGVIISHPHLDHYGLFAEIPSRPPLFIEIGEVTRRRCGGGRIYALRSQVGASLRRLGHAHAGSW